LSLGAVLASADLSAGCVLWRERPVDLWTTQERCPQAPQAQQQWKTADNLYAANAGAIDGTL